MCVCVCVCVVWVSGGYFVEGRAWLNCLLLFLHFSTQKTTQPPIPGLNAPCPHPKPHALKPLKPTVTKA